MKVEKRAVMSKGMITYLKLDVFIQGKGDEEVELSDEETKVKKNTKMDDLRKGFKMTFQKSSKLISL